MQQVIFLILILTFTSRYAYTHIAYTHITEHPSTKTKLVRLILSHVCEKVN